MTGHINEEKEPEEADARDAAGSGVIVAAARCSSWQGASFLRAKAPPCSFPLHLEQRLEQRQTRNRFCLIVR